MYNYSKRVCVLYCCVIVVMAILCVRIYSLLSADKNQALSVLEGQYSGKLKVAEHTGFVYDRNMQLLSHDKMSPILLVNPAVCTDFVKTAEKISTVSKVMSLSELHSKLFDGVPFTVTVKEDECNKAKTISDNADGIYYVDVYEENFNTAKHFMGYRDIDGNGVGGLRGNFNNKLIQSMKAELFATFSTNAKQKSLSEFDINMESYTRGDGIITTLDKNIQNFCDSLESTIQSGVVVVTDVTNGEILALSSYPTFDAQNIAQVLESYKGELINRAEYSYTPGSVFKIVVSLAGLEKDLSLYELEYNCTGKIEVDGDIFRCHNRNGHGKITLEDAFSLSCNTYFVNFANVIGYESIVDTARKLELDRICTADFLYERNNTFLNENDKTAGYLANISFGQGDLSLSVLDMTRIVISAVSGKLCDLSVIKGEISQGFPLKYHEKQTKRVFDNEVCQKMLCMMEKCVNEGTGTSAKVESSIVGGKTGTAQTGRKNAQNEELVNKWFCGVYQGKKSLYCVCVLYDFVLENSPSPGVAFSKIIERMIENGF